MWFFKRNWWKLHILLDKKMKIKSNEIYNSDDLQCDMITKYVRQLYMLILQVQSEACLHKVTPKIHIILDLNSTFFQLN